MFDDILYNLRKAFAIPNMVVPQVELKNCVLFELELLFNNASTSLEKYYLPMPDANKMLEIKNKLLREELNYDCEELLKKHNILKLQLNQDQKCIYDCVIETVNKKEKGLFFVYGHGGTGKTFLWDTIICRLRSEGKIVLAVASSGIASLLLPGSRTAHSRFKIPLVITDSSICAIKKKTHLATLIENTYLIIWDEAPMNHKHCFEALDKSLSDILSHLHGSENKIPLGGKPLLLGGDFRQILPVIPGGTKEDIINASLNTSYLWSHFKNFKLKENMRLSRSGIRAEEKQNISDFADWILQIGDGKISDITDENNLNDKDTSLIKIPTNLIVHSSGNPISSIFLVTYPNFETSFTNFDYLRERAIITPRNTTVTDLNNYIIELLPGEQHVFLSYDSLCSSNGNVENLEA
ncbi:ATP-dependent DNA helicase pif1 isoform X1 [Pyrus x bretschneideri]|uniref:ATP-dependent DNA helicase pif1 isoform X1 n=1 Tax=Pyrus x bretschneideri TaxID=225117 RepID=UPI00202F8627|nr:ATP-dependent DNA helicase pif1 isoform X1 [Pyrus x bretschneideri]